MILNIVLNIILVIAMILTIIEGLRNYRLNRKMIDSYGNNKNKLEKDVIEINRTPYIIDELVCIYSGTGVCVYYTDSAAKQVDTVVDIFNRYDMQNVTKSNKLIENLKYIVLYSIEPDEFGLRYDGKIDFVFKNTDTVLTYCGEVYPYPENQIKHFLRKIIKDMQ